MNAPVRVLVVGCGQMGQSHLKAYTQMDGFEVAGLVNRSRGPIDSALEIVGEGSDMVPTFHDLADALDNAKYDAVSINTYPDTHAEYAVAALEQLALLEAIISEADMSVHVEDAVRSLAIVLAADESVRTGKTVEL